MTTQFTTTQINTSTISATNSQQFHRSTTVHHMASVSSVVSATTDVNRVTRSKGVLIYV